MSKDKTFDAPTDAHGKAEKEGVDFAAIKKYWNQRHDETNSAMRRLTMMSDQRKRNVRARIRDSGGKVDLIYKAIDNAMASGFMNGNNKSGWVASFDWIMCPTNFPKVLEGAYDGYRIPMQAAPPGQGNIAKPNTQGNDRLNIRRGAPAPRLSDEEYGRQNTWEACE